MASNSLPVPLVDKSGTIAAGGVSQTLAAQRLDRSYLLVQNTSIGDLWINFDIPAVAASPSIKLIAGASAEWTGGTVPNNLVTIFGATIAQSYTAKEA